MAFTTKKVKTETLGEYLQSCRSHLGLSLLDAAKLSQVQPKFISALEEGRFRDLPAAVYVRGFLRSLAQVYRVTAAGLLEQFAAESQISANLLASAAPETPGGRFVFRRFILSPRTAMLLGAVILAIVSLSYLYFQISSLGRAPRLQVFSPESDMVINSGSLLVRGQTEPGASVFLNNQALVSDSSGEFRENLSLGPGANRLVIKAVNQFGQETVVTRSVNFQEKEIAGSFTSIETPGEELVLEVLIGPGSAWIYLEADGIEQASGTMLPNSRKAIAAKDKIVLTTGNAGSTRAIFKGKDLGVLGKEGEVIRDIEFTK